LDSLFFEEIHVASCLFKLVLKQRIVRLAEDNSQGRVPVESHNMAVDLAFASPGMNTMNGLDSGKRIKTDMIGLNAHNVAYN
jgi:hypothetical protein